ncbi:MAG: OmpA family protein [Gemmatimonadetes bacterium]|nr:OmpA family protein [Gemmatimonadota bacterium]
MTEPTTPPPDDPRPEEAAGEGAELEELRRILYGPGLSRMHRLQERWDDPAARAEDVGEVLPEAILARSSRDGRIAEAFGPTIEGAIKVSIQKHRHVLVDALFPVMGPAIRKAVSTALLGMVQSFNQALEHGFSLRGLKWRLEAMRTGKSFGEIVLLHTLVYQVEQVFLIHKATGLVLNHVVADDATAQDPDLVASMLTALQDFVRDSFHAEEGETLDTLQVGGDRVVWIDQGQHAVLAAAIRGTPPLELRTVLREVLDVIHLTHGEALAGFDGDTGPFEAVADHLRGCLRSQRASSERRLSPVFWGVIALAVLLGAAWLALAVRDARRWSRYLDRLHEEPGIVVTGTEKRAGHREVFGLRDPLATDPASLLEAEGIDPDDVVFRWESYQSQDSALALPRIRKLLRPPSTVQLTLSEGTLTATGSAPHAWVVGARALMDAQLAFQRYDDEGVVDTERLELDALRDTLQSALILFGFDSAVLRRDQADRLQALVPGLRRLFALAEDLDLIAAIGIVGHADEIGTPEGNMEVSRVRAATVRSFLAAAGLDPDRLSTTGKGATEPLPGTAPGEDERNRRVVFQVRLDPKPGPAGEGGP